MLILFVYHQSCIPSHACEEILARFFDLQRIVFRIDRIPPVFIGFGIHNINTGKSAQESFRDLSEYGFTVRLLTPFDFFIHIFKAAHDAGLSAW